MKRVKNFKIKMVERKTKNKSLPYEEILVVSTYKGKDEFHYGLSSYPNSARYNPEEAFSLYLEMARQAILYPNWESWYVMETEDLKRMTPASFAALS